MRTILNGVEIFVGQGGVAWQPEQGTLVLQHGAGMDRTVWVLLARYFARHGFNVVAPDLPAHGASGGQALTSIQAQAEHLWLLLDHLQAEHGLPADNLRVFGGHSMGALLITEAAAQRPDQVDHLLLFGAGYPMPVAQPLLEAAKANEQSAIDMIAIYSHCLKSQLGHNAVAGISVQNSAVALLERAAPGVLHADLVACNAYQGLEQTAAILNRHRGSNNKATLIMGAEDRMTPMTMSRNLAEALGAQCVVLDNCGHMIMSEQPEATLQAVKQALSSPVLGTGGRLPAPC